MIVAGVEKDSASLRIPPALAKIASPSCTEQLFLQLRCIPHLYPGTCTQPELSAVSAQSLGSPGSDPCEELGRRWGVTVRLWRFWDRFVEHQPCSHKQNFSDLLLCNPSCGACHGLMPFCAVFNFRDFPPDPSFSVQHFLFNFLFFSFCLFLFLSCFSHSTEILLNLFKTPFACQTFCAVLTSRKKAKLSVWKSIHGLFFRVVYLQQAATAPGLCWGHSTLLCPRSLGSHNCSAPFWWVFNKFTIFLQPACLSGSLLPLPMKESPITLYKKIKDINQVVLLCIQLTLVKQNCSSE